MKPWIFTALFVACIATSCSHGRLEMNYHSADISTLPDEHVVLAGFAARHGLSDGIHQNLRTHCLVIKDDAGQKVCIISNDLMEISPAITDTLRTMISERSGLARENILIHNIHTHSAPRSGGASVIAGGTNREWKFRMIDSLVGNAVRTITAEKEFSSFRLETGKAETIINGNRCEKEGPCDHDVYVARFIRKKHPMVTIVNLACHPVCMGPGSHALSSDYPGICGKILSEEWGGEVFQLTGAAGNMDPVLGPQDASYAEECGKSLASSLLGMTFTRIENKGLMRLVNETIDLPYKADQITPELVRRHADSLVRTSSKVSASFGEDVRNWESEILDRFKSGQVPNKLRYNVHVVDLDGVLFFFSDGEPFCEYQTEAREYFPDKTIFFAGYTNGQNSYLPSERAYKVRKGYEYETEQMHIYIKAPYPLSEKCPSVYLNGVKNILSEAIASETEEPVGNAASYGIIPAPESLMPRPGKFTLDNRTGLQVETDDEEFARAAEVFIDRVRTASGLDIVCKNKKRKEIILRKVEGLGPEEYRLKVSPEDIVAEAATPAGAFYSLQTLLQLLPPEIYSSKKITGIKWTIPCCEISDKPAFSYRGMMLDCGRHFYPKEFVKKFIDQMSILKLNMFHWHLTEDQGWRIEIKKYPLLTEVGSKRPYTADYDDKNPDGKPHEGFYTQEDIKEIVDYAALRHVTVVPEIEVPGHSTAALAAYPALSCDSTKTYKVSTCWGIKEDVYCPSEFTFRFLEDVFTEMLPLFPSRYWHIGGDECPQKAWKESAFCRNLMKQKGLKSYDEIQSLFVNRVSSFLRSHGKTVIGWDEILDGGNVDGMVAQSYRGHAPAAKGIRRGHYVILSPDRWCYYNYYQADPETEPKANSLLLTLKKAYNYYPVVDSLPELSKKYIIGAEGCVWGEFIPDVNSAEYWTFPRMAAMSEVGWTERQNKDWQSFRVRMEKEMKRLEASEIACSKVYWNVIFDYDSINLPRPVDADLMLEYPYAAIHYTTDGTDPTPDSPVFSRKFTPGKGVIVKAQGFTHDGRPVGKPTSKRF